MLSNRVHLFIIFLLAGITGGILSVIFLPEGVSVGASGGILGFLGYLTIYALKRRKLLPGYFLNNLLINIGLVTFFGLFVIRNTDNFAHLGGFLAGFIYGLIQIPGDLYQDPRQPGKIARIAGIAALSIFLLVCLSTMMILLEIIKIPLPEDIF